MSDKIANAVVSGGVQSRGLWADAWRRFRKDRLAAMGLAVILVLILVAIATLVVDWATHNAIYDEYVIKQNLSMKLAGPSLEHIFGCDEYGRDILFRLIWGTRYSLFIGIVSILFALVCGGALGAVAGFYSGWVDNLIMRVMDVFLSIPSMVMAIAIVSALGTGTFNLLLSISVPQIPRLARIVRASVMSVKDREFVEAARAVGAGDALIIFKYVIPNCLAPIIVQASLNVGTAILNIAGLSFLGIGVETPTPEWGSILNEGRNFITFAWWPTLFPGLFLAVSGVGFSLLGDGLTDFLRTKGR